MPALSVPLVATVEIPASYALSLLNLMVERGHQDADVLSGLPLQRAQLLDERARIPAWQYGAMIQRARELEPDHGLAYELGLRSQVTRHGFVGFGLMSCSTLAEAIAFAERYLKARVPTFHHTLTVQGDEAVVTVESALPLGSQRAFVMDMVVVELCCLFARVVGRNPGQGGWHSVIHVSHPEPPAYARYRDRLPPFKFNQPAVQIRFPVAQLQTAIATADPVTHRLAQERCEAELDTTPADTPLPEAVLRALVSTDGRYPELAEVAQHLKLSERTLKRRLQAEQTSYQALLDQARLRDAERLLRRPRISVAEVATALGYADPANFARAFTRWTGLSPRAWRQRAGLK